MKIFKITIILSALACCTLIIGLLQHRKIEQPHTKEMKSLLNGMAEGEPVFDDQMVAGIIEDILPMIEEAVGKKFTRSPRVVLTDREGAVKALVRDLLPQYRKLMPYKSEEQTGKAALEYAKWFSMTLLGKYGIHDKVLYLLPGNFEPILKTSPFDLKRIRSVLQMVVAHELTHCIQDQEINLGKKLERAGSGTEIETISASIEGHAVFVQEIIGKKLGMDQGIINLSNHFMVGPPNYDDQAMRMASRMEKVRLGKIYLGGKLFIEYHHGKGGNRRVWEILKNPPAKSSMILEPATYQSEHIGSVDYLNVLTDVEDYLNEYSYMTQNIEISKIQLHSSYLIVEPKEREKLISSIEHVQALLLRDGETLLGGVTFILMKDPGSCSKFISVIERAASRNIKKMEKSGIYNVEQFVLENYPGIDGECTRKSIILLSFKHSSESIPKSKIIRICRDGVIAEIIDNNLNISDSEIAIIVEKVFSGYRKIKTKWENKNSSAQNVNFSDS